MYRLTRHDGDLAKRRGEMPVPFGPGWSADIIARLDGLDVYASEISDEGPDFCECVGRDAAGTEIARTRIEGY